VSNFALSLLVADVKALFVAEVSAGGATANVVFGKREPTKQVNQGPGRANRVVFSPGDPSGKAGTLEGAKLDRRGVFGGRKRTSRSLATFRELATVYCWACDATDAATKNDESKQYDAARLLFDQVVRAIYRSPNVGHGGFKISGAQWIQNKVERVDGAEIMFLLEIEAMVPDEPGLGDAPTAVVNPTEATGPAKIATDTTTDPVVYETDGTDISPP